MYYDDTLFFNSNPLSLSLSWSLFPGSAPRSYGYPSKSY